MQNRRSIRTAFSNVKSAEFSRRKFLASSLGVAAWSFPNPLLASNSPRPAATRALVIQLPGGPSQLELWDPKPSAPAEIRGPLAAISTSTPGITLGELFPRLAQQTHRVAFVRSLYHDAVPTHDAGLACLAWPDSQQLQPVSAGTPRTRLCSRDRQLYGSGPFGRQCALARQLLEQEAGLVTLNAGCLQQLPNWDCHAQPQHHPSSLADYQATLCPGLDQALSGLLEDLGQRGLLEETLVVVSGEMGRTPKLNRAGGRDHWPHCWTGLFAGAGITGGAILGCSDSHAAYPVENPIHSSRIPATVQYALGLAPTTGEPIEQLWA